MNMHDKDMDALFRNKLEGFEMMPSADVWNNISAQLNTGKKRRMVPVWGIAASVALLIGAGLFLIPGLKKTNNVEQGDQIARVEHNRPTVKENITETSARPEVIETRATAQPNRKYIAANPVKTTAKKQVVKAASTTQEIANTPDVQTPDQQAVIAAVTTKPETSSVRTAVVPDDVPLAPASMTNDVQTVTPVKVMAANIQPTQEIASKPAKHRVHTLGDLINNVVGSIDKRKDKLIEFTDSDDDQANITGINLGIFKLKKSNK